MRWQYTDQLLHELDNGDVLTSEQTIPVETNVRWMERKGSSLKCQIISLSMLAIQLNHFIRLSRSARSNIVWWYTYSREWNGVSKISVVNKTDPRFSVTIDVSGSWCCGAFFNTQSLSFPWCINKEYVWFSQTSVLSILQYKSSQCTYSIRTAFMSICNVLALECLCHTTKWRIYIR